MGETNRDVELFAAFRLRAVTGAYQFQRFGKAVGHTHNHVVHKGAVQAVHGLVRFGFRGSVERQNAVFLLQRDVGVHRLGQRALGAFDCHGVRLVHLDRHARGDSDRKFSDSGHCLTPPLRVGYQM
ncbi:hypothetical protein SDC9_201100 [bioreactor metagenome]|uniref:Uncharacterized protein n=1 Tax=bioreactor metagenome TaxID=1076179 RepID=A0A645IQQ9_9ZZZZ